jgi:uncharacterized protein YjiS (DUF1127 family)
MQVLHCCIATFELLQRTKHAYLPAVARQSPSRKMKGANMLLSHIVRALRSWRRYNKSVRELSRLGDRELADIGIARSDIPSVAWLSAQN